MTFNKGYGGGKKYDDRPSQNRTFDEIFKPEWISGGITMETVSFADKLGRFIKDNGLTTSQIRNVFGEIKRIQLKGFINEKPSFFLLKPKMAYAAKRAGNTGITTFKRFFDEAHAQVADEQSFQNLVDFFESVLAYHKAYGGRD